MTQPKEDWWTPMQLALVEDRCRCWQAQTFRPSDALVQSPTNEIEVMPEGWDHEHCTLCWQKISLRSGDCQSGYTDGKSWLCTECYEKFIIPRLAAA
jgi:hypothetical protein